MARIEFQIHFTGAEAEKHQLDFYDAAHALVGFQRSLALTAHLIANGEIITQAPSLKEARILSLPPEQGGWSTRAVIAFGTMLGGLAIAPHDSVAGNIAMSVYDFVLSEALGVHADYNKTIGQLIEANKEQYPGTKLITQGRLDSLVEKCEVAITDMHRPIVKSETASEAEILANFAGQQIPIGPSFTYDTYDYIKFTSRSDAPIQSVGRISGYDSNTFKGRVFISQYNRPIPFELAENARSPRSIQIITNNLAANAQGRRTDIRIFAFHDLSRTGRLKRLLIVEIEPPNM